MKASNIGDAVTGTVIQALQRNAGQRLSMTMIAEHACIDMSRARRAVAELVAKGVIRSGAKKKASHVPSYWLSTDKVAEDLLLEKSKASGSGQIAGRRRFDERPLDVSIMGVRPIRAGAGLAAQPGITINQSVYDRSRS